MAELQKGRVGAQMSYFYSDFYRYICTTLFSSHEHTTGALIWTFEIFSSAGMKKLFFMSFNCLQKIKGKGGNRSKSILSVSHGLFRYFAK
jgi:hypothetical protein